MITQEQYRQIVQGAVDRCFGMMTEPDKLYVMMPASIGDTIIAGGFIHTLLQRFKKKSAVYIIQERYRPFEIMFDGVSKIEYLNNIDFAYVSQLIHAKRLYFSDNWFWAYIHNDANNKQIWDEDLLFVKNFQHNVFDLPLDKTFFHAPVVKDISDQVKRRFNDQYVLDKERTVILAPRANTPFVSPSLRFWQNLAAYLRQRGHIVYTNIGKNAAGIVDNTLQDVPPLNANLNEIFYLADKVKYIIGLRSGLLDLLAFSKGNIVCLSPAKFHSGDLKLIYPGTPSKIRSLYFNFEFFPKLNELMASFDIESMVVSSFKHKYIPTEDMFFREDQLLEAIIREVDVR